MFDFPIGVMLDSFRLPVRQALEKTASLGLKGIQVYATGRILSPDTTKEGVREFADLVESHGLVVSSLCGDFGAGLHDPEKNPVLIDKSKRVLELSKALGCGIVTTHIGVIPEDKNHPRYAVMQKACFELASFADSIGAKFAVETGPERAEVLRGFLDELGSTGVSVNLDPANLVMVTGDDPVKAVYSLRNYIVHTHAKDGRMLLKKKPEIVYGIEKDTENAGPSYEELPLGRGSVDFPAYLAALEEIGFRGFLTIEREVGADPAADISLAADYLRNVIRKGE